MDFSWITPTFVIAVLALWIGYSNYRRNNFAIIRVRECSCSYVKSVEENGGVMFCYLRIVFQNLGIPLYNLRMALTFTDKNGSGRFSLPLKAGNSSKVREGQFAKGMITDFGLKSYQLNKEDLAFLRRLEDTTKQTTTLCLYAEGFLAWEYRLYGILNPVKRLWNRLAWKVNLLPKKQMGINAQGTPIVKYYTLLPTFMLPSLPVMELTNRLRKGLDFEEAA